MAFCVRQAEAYSSKDEMIPLLFRVVFEKVSKHFPKLFLVLDGLDECEDLHELHEILGGLRKIDTSKVHIILASRDCIRSQVLSIFKDDIGVEDIPVTTEEARRDVATFVRTEVRRLDLRNLMNEDAAVDLLLNGCDALFLLAYYRLKLLSTNRGRIHTQEDLDKILSTLPADLREFYDRTLRNLEMQGPSKCILMRKIFLWLTYAKRQLTFRELSTALSVVVGNDSSVISSQHLIPGGLESLCGGLVILMPRKDTESSEELRIVALAHNSVKEYVSDFAWHLQSPLPLLRDSSACNSEIVQAPIAYMYSNQGKPLSNSSFLDYVYRFWMKHLFGTDTPTPSLTNNLVKFFPSGECLAWWESTGRDLHWGINDIHILQSEFRSWITKVAPSGSKLGQTIEFMTTLQKKQLEACAKKHGKSHPLSLKFMANLVSTYLISGRPQEAESIGAELVSRGKKANLSKNPDTLDALSELAEVYGSLPPMSRLGWKEAEDLQKLIIETRTSTTASDKRDAGILKSMLGLAAICGREGRIKEADLYSQKVIDIGEGIIGDLEQPDVLKEQIDSKDLETAGCAIALVRDDPEIIEIMNTLVSAYRNLGKTLDAERVALKVFAKSAKVFGKKDPHTLSAMEHLASVYGSQGRSQDALKLGQKAFDTRVEVLGQDHPDTIKAMGLLGSCYMMQGHIKKAQDLAVKLLDIRRRVLGNDNPSTLASIHVLMQIHVEQWQWQEAEGLIRELIAVSTRIRGPDHPETLGAENRLAMVYGSQGRMPESESINLEVFEKSKKIHGMNHPFTWDAMDRLAMAYARSAKSKEAESLVLRVIKNREVFEKYTHDDTEVLEARLHLSKIYEIEGRFQDMVDLKLQVMSTLMNSQRHEHQITLMVLETLQMDILELGRWEEAEKYNEVSTKKFIKTFGEGHPRTLSIMSVKAEIYFQLGRSREAIDIILQVIETGKRSLGEECKAVN